MADDEPKPPAPQGGGSWKVLVVFTFGIAAGLAYLNQQRIAGALSPREAEMPTPDVVTLTAPRAKPVEPSPTNMMPTVVVENDAGAPKDAGAAKKP